MMSNVGNAQVYESNEQRTGKYDTQEHPAPYEAGQPNAHDQLDSRDNRSLHQTAAQAEKQLARDQSNPDSAIRPAEMHGNKPSRGAQVDKEIMEDEQEELRQKGRA
ncbi:hypothetical protein PUNSTDRAFT_58280 [Punctularia strigosozonata HHB-11173 SS5]|uniref:uncharacterized protein n=1 Tax=Punctularia strigosozonata (strain HHB-11173) TaxID=741275 RepID=UPI0004416B16|nr:uncharacterized protein PUNSTDRAFT_58280 [Punctularia strigosozonata HHB-11173 SS5]EIN14307.1 hypothetical protein PUNSTDRAFT_58280 [Punctularia strigosozonata HHB-11173 SS5]